MAALLDFLVVILIALALIVLQVPAYIASLLGLTRLAPDTSFPNFSFDELTKPKLTKLLEQVVLFIAITSLPLHILAFLLRQTFLSHTAAVLIALLVLLLQLAVFYLASSILFALDPKKSALLAVANTAFYAILYFTFIHNALH